MVTEKIHGNVKGEREIRKIARARTEFLVQHIQGQNKLVLLLIIVNNIPIIDWNTKYSFFVHLQLSRRAAEQRKLIIRTRKNEVANVRFAQRNRDLSARNREMQVFISERGDRTRKEISERGDK